MKLFNNISLGVLGALFSLSSCSYYERFDAPEVEILDAPEATMTFAQLKSKFMTEDYKLFDNKENSKYAQAFTGFQIPANANAIVDAVVISSDVEGNTYKELVCFCPADGSTLDISVDVGSLSGVYPQGQRVSIDCSGLHIGDYANSPVLGYTLYNDDAKRLRYEIGRLSAPVAYSRITPIGLPDTTLIKPEVMTIEEIKKMGPAAYGRIVRIKGVSFGYYVNSEFESNDVKWVDETGESNIPFAYENSLNVPVSRALRDATGRINLTTSAYAKFADKGLPRIEVDELDRPEHTFDIIAIVGWYRDQMAKEGSYQLSLQRYSDIIRMPL